MMDKEMLRDLREELAWWWDSGRMFLMAEDLRKARQVVAEESLEDMGLTQEELHERLRVVERLAQLAERLDALRVFCESDEEGDDVRFLDSFGHSEDKRGKEASHGEE